MQKMRGSKHVISIAIYACIIIVIPIVLNAQVSIDFPTCFADGSPNGVAIQRFTGTCTEYIGYGGFGGNITKNRLGSKIYNLDECEGSIDPLPNQVDCDLHDAKKCCELLGLRYVEPIYIGGSFEYPFRQFLFRVLVLGLALSPIVGFLLGRVWYLIRRRKHPTASNKRLFYTITASLMVLLLLLYSIARIILYNFQSAI